MSHIGKFTVFAALLLPLALGGCKPRKGTANPEDYFPLIQVALAGGETAAMIGRNEALEAKHFEGCVAAESLISGFDAANQILAGRLADKIVVPAVDIDVSECLMLREGDESAMVPYVHESRVAGYVAPVAGEEEAEEAAVAGEEEAAVEAPESSSLKGNEDAAVLVEAIAGITVAAVLHYATKLKDANCKKGTAALGAVHYVSGMIKPVAEEIANPDGMVSVPAVTIDLSECNEG